MNDLSPEARSMLAAARASGVPTTARRRNIKHAVLLRAAVVTAASAGAGSAGAMSLATKLMLAGAVAGLATGGAFGVWKLHHARVASGALPPPTARAWSVAARTTPSGTAVHEPGIGPAAEAPRAPSVSHEPAHPVASRLPPHETIRARQASAPPPPAAPTNAEQGLEIEVAFLRRAHEALRDGDPTLALRVLADYDRAFPRGALSEEREAIAAIAVCQARPGPDARARAQAFLRDAPSSLLGERVRLACFPGANVSPR